jgi:hypothetical protein
MENPAKDDNLLAELRKQIALDEEKLEHLLAESTAQALESPLDTQS